jgi:hypothetical protein
MEQYLLHSRTLLSFFVNSLVSIDFNINKGTMSTSEIQGSNLSCHLYENKD